MSSGRKAIRQNTRERVISSDWNRMQSFASGYANEAMREQMLSPVDMIRYYGSTFTTAVAGSAATDVLLPAAPDDGGVMNGLMVVVPAGANYYTITSGMLLVVDPEGASGSSDPTPLSPDDGPGPGRLVYSGGISATNVLNWVTNLGAGPRLDIIECQREQLVVETDNRDIYNPSTGLFSPNNVTKVVAGDLQFRIRTGTPGGLLPPPALGWVPLAVVSTPTAAVSLDDCTVWDVRPLLSDRLYPYANVQENTRVTRGTASSGYPSGAAYQVRGFVEGTYQGWRIGGSLSIDNSSPKDIMSAAYLSPTFSYASQAYINAVWPQGYVRWVQYMPTVPAGAAGRVPGSFRGMMVLSNQHLPFSFSAVSLPTLYGNFGTSSRGLSLLTVPVSVFGGGTAYAFTFDGSNEYVSYDGSTSGSVASSNIGTQQYRAILAINKSGVLSSANRVRVKIEYDFGTFFTGDHGLIRTTVNVCDATDTQRNELGGSDTWFDYSIDPTPTSAANVVTYVDVPMLGFDATPNTVYLSVYIDASKCVVSGPTAPSVNFGVISFDIV